MAFFFSPQARLHFRNGGVTIVVTMTITTTAEKTLASTTFFPLMLSPAPGQFFALRPERVALFLQLLFEGLGVPGLIDRC